MKRKPKAACVVALDERELYTVLAGLRMLLGHTVMLDRGKVLDMKDTRRLARQLARTHATLAN